MPDVIINWDPDARVTTAAFQRKLGQAARASIAGYAVTPYYTGNHRPNAFMAVVGPGVGPGLVLEGASILDLAPTVLARFGIAAPAHMDGRVLNELTATETLQPHS